MIFYLDIFAVITNFAVITEEGVVCNVLLLTDYKDNGE